MKKMMFMAFFVVLVLPAVACSRTKLHSWQTRGDANVIEVSTAQWEILSIKNYQRVAPGELPRATQLLESHEFIAIDDDTARGLCPRFTIEAGTGTLYLVRGVAYIPPTYAIIKYSHETGQLVIHQATYDGEIIPSFMMGSPQPWPFIVALPLPPTKVYATTLLGGDWIFSRVKVNQLDMRPIEWPHDAELDARSSILQTINDAGPHSRD